MTIADNINQIRETLKNYPESNLIAVSKTVENEGIIEAIKAGCKVFGENKVQEAKDKWTVLKSQYPDVKLHLIGHLQSNKAKEAMEIFDVIQTLGSEKLAEIFAKEIEKQNIGQKRQPEFFVQINIGEEIQKSGVNPRDAKVFIRKMIDEYKLNVTGIMAIPPVNEEPALYFALMRKIQIENNLKNLSIGMSADYQTALEFGATHIRVGTAIFGNRINN